MYWNVLRVSLPLCAHCEVSRAVWQRLVASLGDEELFLGKEAPYLYIYNIALYPRKKALFCKGTVQVEFEAVLREGMYCNVLD